MVAEVVEVVVHETEEAVVNRLVVSRPEPDSREVLRQQVQLRDNIGVPNTRISHLGRGQGARCTIAGGRLHFSVRNPIHAHGRTSLFQSLQNETVTSSAQLIK